MILSGVSVIPRMIKLAALRSDLIFLETQMAVVLKEVKIGILAAFHPKGTKRTVHHATLFKQF